MKVAVVTGASRGLGRAFVEGLLDRGYFVYAISRSGDVPEALDCRSVQADLSLPGAANMLAQNLFPAIQDRSPDELLLINNAGTLSPMGRFEQAEVSAIEPSITLNLTTPTVLSAGLLKHFQKEKDFPMTILNISSGAANTDYEGWALYCGAKAGLDRVTTVVAKEQAQLESETRIYSIAPGVLNTDMQAQIRGMNPSDFPMVERFKSLHESQELVNPESAAAKILAFIMQKPDSGRYDIRDL